MWRIYSNCLINDFLNILSKLYLWFFLKKLCANKCGFDEMILEIVQSAYFCGVEPNTLIFGSANSQSFLFTIQIQNPIHKYYHAHPILSAIPPSLFWPVVNRDAPCDIMVSHYTRIPACVAVAIPSIHSSCYIVDANQAFPIEYSVQGLPGSW